MSPVPLLDRAHLDAQTYGDDAFARELLDLFEGQCRRLLPVILDGSAEPAARADRAHTLKGSALGVGAGQVARASAEVEDRLRADDRNAPLAALAATVAATLAEIARYPGDARDAVTPVGAASRERPGAEPGATRGS